MALTRPVPRAGRPPTHRTRPGPASAARYAESLEALLGDPRDRANPYGRFALRAAGYDALPAPPAGLPVAGHAGPAADQLARALRPLFRRDLALAHAWSIRPLLSGPLPHPAAALLGPAALLASAAGVLSGVTRVVDGLSRYEPGARRWRPVLASIFVDLLACESLTAVALRTCADRESGAAGPGTDGNSAEVSGTAGFGADAPGTEGSRAGGLRPARQPGGSLGDVVGYVVPQLAGELLGDLELVLSECGFGGATPERRALDKVLRDRAFVGGDWAAGRAAQARSVRGLSAVGGSGQGGGTGLAGLFRITEEAGAVAPGDGSPWAVVATLGGAVDRLAGDGGPGTAALARAGRRLATEQRALRVACAATVVHDPGDPAARALADRQALLVLAAAALGVREAAAGARLPFLGEAGWALLALGRIAGRLGLPLPDGMPDPQPAVWEELARRAADGVDCDLYATRLPW